MWHFSCSLFTDPSRLLESLPLSVCSFQVIFFQTALDFWMQSQCGPVLGHKFSGEYKKLVFRTILLEFGSKFYPWRVVADWSREGPIEYKWHNYFVTTSFEALIYEITEARRPSCQTVNRVRLSGRKLPYFYYEWSLEEPVDCERQRGSLSVKKQKAKFLNEVFKTLNSFFQSFRHECGPSQSLFYRITARCPSASCLDISQRKIEVACKPFNF